MITTFHKSIKHLPENCWRWDLTGWVNMPSADVQVHGYTTTRAQARQALKDMLEKLNK